MAMQAAYELCERLDAAAGTLVLSRDQADDTVRLGWEVGGGRERGVRG